MIVLALESSAIAASVALQKDDRLLAEMTLNRGNTHSENLLPMVESLLSRLDLTIDNIDLFAVSVGPGSFTGVRIGVATVKGLAFGKGKPCVGVSTLEALAENLAFLSDSLICPVMNARRNQVYTALFRGKNCLLPDSAISVEELENILSAYSEPVLFVGDGYDLVTSQIEHPYLPVSERLRLQSAASVASVALRKTAEGKSLTDARLSPVYLRPSQAERTRAEKMKQQAEK
ncbi:MAG: tRNA (adenosine(37)-N6)-threonylcarbamoyltransferase complex dimerization subunit type 1 TsaB [Ruminococcaceae bacterium]|nr:tRNA (adenosine(37)-N6)-threonylcarbamoyltransferase complex dimerization subunit type 1 TsaB [Oscillospiraceae bacterium]